MLRQGFSAAVVSVTFPGMASLSPGEEWKTAGCEQPMAFIED